MTRFAVLVMLGWGFVVGCRSEQTQDPAEAQQAYGASVDATEAVLAPAVAAEARLYKGRAFTIDGRITAVAGNGCVLRLDTGDNPPLLVRAARTDDGACAWQVPPETNGFAVAAGTLRAAGDTLRLTANGVRVTPVRLSKPNS